MKPISAKTSSILILGSIPGMESLKKQEYYAHKRNVFWPIIFKLFNESHTQNYREKRKILLKYNIALWDIVDTCQRKGSLDNEISKIKLNRIESFLKKHKNIRVVFLNGRKAETLFKKFFQVLNVLHRYLPSTSPAYPQSFNVKSKKWKALLHFLNKGRE
jgi:hypoxanthine-DNA glycosylase